jgi:hypothetical protein
VGTGVPADKKRDVPDVSLTAAGHDGYLIYMNGSLGSVGGTSAASPAFAGLMAMVVQNSGARQGNPNPTFYSIAAKQAAGGSAIFHDITTGNNSVPGVTGFSAGMGYDLATGLGSVDGTMLVTHWSDATSIPGFQVAVDASSLPVRAGASAAVYFTSSISGGFSAPITFSMTSLPAGALATFVPPSFAAPGSGKGALTITASAATRAGSYLANLVGTSGSLTRTAALTVTITPAADYTLTLSPTSVSVAPGKTGSMTATTTANAGFNAAINISVSGLPPGVTASFSRPTITAPGSGASTLTFSVAKTATPGSYSVMVTAAGGGMTRRQSFALNIPGFTLNTAHATVSLPTGARTAITLTTRALGGFTSAVALSVSGQPTGVTATLSPQSNGTSTLTIVRGPTAKAATSQLTVTATGGGLTKTTVIGVTVKP